MRILKAAAVIAIATTTSSAFSDVRVVHASPDAPNVDVYVNGDPGNDPPLLSDFPFTGVSPYVPLSTGMYNFKVTETGMTNPLIDVDAMIEGSLDYSIVAGDFASNITPFIFQDDNTSNPNAARVRFIHMSPDVPAVDIFVAGGGSPLFDAVDTFNSGGYVEVPGGTYDLEVRLDGSGDLALEVPDVSVQDGFVYTIFAMGSLRDNNVQAVIAVDAVPAPGALALLAVSGLAVRSRRRR